MCFSLRPTCYGAAIAPGISGCARDHALLIGVEDGHVSRCWRARVVEEALRAFARDLEYAVVLVSPPRSVSRSRRPAPPQVWGAPPRFVSDPPSFR